MPAPLARPTFLVPLALAAILAPGCAGAPAPAALEPGVSPAQAAWDACLGPPPREHRGWSQQGPDLVGTHVVGSEDRSAVVRTFLLEGMTTKDGAPVLEARVTAAGLVGQVGGAEVAGAGLTDARLRAVLDCAGGAGSRPLSARIAAAYRDPRRPSVEAWLYRVEILDADGRPAPACAPDEDGETGALAMAGVWDARGGHVDRPGAVTFACAEAAVAKCVRWGYGPDPGDELLAACTRMARADYCGDGHSETRKGTEIDLWDSRGRVARGAPRGGASFEAAWSRDGAVCMSHPRWPKLAYPCAGRGSAGGPTNDQNLPVCRSQAEAEGLAGPGKALMFDASSVHE
jgi:hypothetical protein